MRPNEIKLYLLLFICKNMPLVREAARRWKSSSKNAFIQLRLKGE